MSPGEKFSLNLGKTLDGNLFPQETYIMYPDTTFLLLSLFVETFLQPKKS